jgi:hypothetical protein
MLEVDISGELVDSSPAVKTQHEIHYREGSIKVYP